MRDREFLIWLHERLERVHGEIATVDYMHKLRAIIKATDKDKITPNMVTNNSMAKLKQEISSRE